MNPTKANLEFEKNIQRKIKCQIFAIEKIQLELQEQISELDLLITSIRDEAGAEILKFSQTNN